MYVGTAPSARIFHSAVFRSVETVQESEASSSVDAAASSSASSSTSSSTSTTTRSLIYVFGGRVGKRKSSNELFQLDTDTLQWSLVPTSGITPTARWGHICVLREPYLLVIGGYDKQEAVWNVEQLDLNTLTWSINTQLTDLCPGDRSLTCSAYGITASKVCYCYRLERRERVTHALPLLCVYCTHVSNSSLASVCIISSSFIKWFAHLMPSTYICLSLCLSLSIHLCVCVGLHVWWYAHDFV